MQVALEHQKGRRFKEAERLYRQVLSREPDNATALHNLGWLAHVGGDDGSASQLIRRALELVPADWAMHYNLGRIMIQSGKLNEAAAHLERAVSLNPKFASIHVDLGVTLSSLGKAHEAPACFQRALAVDPTLAGAFSNYLHALNYLPEADVSSIFEEHLNFARRFSPPMLPVEPERPRHPIDARIKLGYVSGEFRQFAVARFIEPIIANHDRAAFEVFCYSNHGTVDEVTRRLRSSAEHWRTIVGLSDREAAQLVRRDGIDVLVDLSGHTRDNRLTMFALKPAPVQVSWLGYFNTTGLREIDYLITDPISSPPGDAQPFTESLLRMPSVRLCYEPPSYAPEVGPLPALTAGCVTFGTFNKLVKLNDSVIALWAAVLAAIPNSRLVLKAQAFNEAVSQDRYREVFQAHGIGAERLLLRPNSPHTQMLDEYGEIDIALDPFPFTGGLTTCEALWQGVPVLTLRGDSMVSRQSASILTAIGLTDWIAESAVEYEAKAIRFARNTDALAKLRATLRQRMARSPVCDARSFTRNLEHLYRNAWLEWREGAWNAPPRVPFQT